MKFWPVAEPSTENTVVFAAAIQGNSEITKYGLTNYLIIYSTDAIVKPWRVFVKPFLTLRLLTEAARLVN